MKYLMLLILLCGASSWACETLPQGFSFREVRYTLNVKNLNYTYYIHIEFPNLQKACWQKSSGNTLTADFKGQSIVIRGSSLDETDTNVMDTIELDQLTIERQNDPSFVGLLTPSSLKYSTSFRIYYQSPLASYVVLDQNLPLILKGTKIDRIDFL